MEALNFDINALPTPFIVVDENRLIRNLKILKSVIDETGCKILLAQKAFSMFSLYPLIGEYISGTTASGLFEAKLGYEEMGKENHIFSPTYTEEEFDEILRICGHIVFNSFSQWEKFRD
jgi:carboxynorspermidine decarboxylase